MAAILRKQQLDSLKTAYIQQERRGKMLRNKKKCIAILVLIKFEGF